MHYSTISLILWRSASWGTAVHHLGCAEPPSLPGICSVSQFSSKSPWRDAHGLKPKSLSASHRGPELQPQRHICSLKQKVGFLQEFPGKRGSAEGRSPQTEGRNKHGMNGARTSGSLMSSASEPQRLRRGRAPLAASDKNKRLRGRCQRGSAIPGHPDTPLSIQERGWRSQTWHSSAPAGTSHHPAETAAPASNHGAFPPGLGSPSPPAPL